MSKQTYEHKIILNIGVILLKYLRICLIQPYYPIIDAQSNNSYKMPECIEQRVRLYQTPQNNLIYIAPLGRFIASLRLSSLNPSLCEFLYSMNP